MRLGTASLLGDNSGPFIGVDRLDLRRYAGRPSLARVLCDYILYHDHNPRKALELCAHATKATNFEVGRAGSTCSVLVRPFITVVPRPPGNRS